MTRLLPTNLLKRPRITGLLGLTLDDGRLEGVVLRRTNGSLRLQQSLSVALALDPFANDPQLVGREIRNHLDAAGVRERHCVVGLPLAWALTVGATLPALPEADVMSFLQIEAERGFPCELSTLLVGVSRWQAPDGAWHALQVGMPRGQVARLEQVLRAAQLKPMSFGLGISALQPPEDGSTEGTLALSIGASRVGLQLTCGGGLVALRSLESALGTDAGHRWVYADVVARETRITLGQLPEATRRTIRRVCIFGPAEIAKRLAEEVRLRFEPMGLQVETVLNHPVGAFGVQLPAQAPVCSAFNLAAAALTGRKPPFEFLPPRVTAWQQVAARYSRGTLQRVGVAACAVAVVVAGFFLFQQWQLMRLQSQWAKISTQVRETEALRRQIRQYRPWFDESLPSLSILRQITAAFPEDGVVSAKTVEIRNRTAVSCSGTARDEQGSQALLKTLEKLRVARQVADLKVPTIRGKSPMQFTFEFRWNEGGRNAD